MEPIWTPKLAPKPPQKLAQRGNQNNEPQKTVVKMASSPPISIILNTNHIIPIHTHTHTSRHDKSFRCRPYVRGFGVTLPPRVRSPPPPVDVGVGVVMGLYLGYLGSKQNLMSLGGPWVPRGQLGPWPLALGPWAQNAKPGVKSSHQGSFPPRRSGATACSRDGAQVRTTVLLAT